MADLRLALARLHPVEGVYSLDPDDPGGMTVYGVARTRWPHDPLWPVVDAALAAAGADPSDQRACVAAIEAEPRARRLADEHYRRVWWGPLYLDHLDSQDLAYELFEAHMNTGQGVAILQRALNWLRAEPPGAAGAWPVLEDDNVMGPATWHAWQAARGRCTDRGVVGAMNLMQAAYYAALAERRPSMRKFLRGWIAQRVVDVVRS